MPRQTVLQNVAKLGVFVTLHACTPQAAPVTPNASANTGAGSSAMAMRYADVPMPQPVFVDPARRSKLEAAFPEVERFLTTQIPSLNLPGVAVGIVIDGDLAYAKGFGIRDVQSKGAVDPDSLFRIASMTKSFTAMGILQLRDAGKLHLDEPAAKYVPELAALTYPTRDSAPITIRQLLSHGEGFPEDNPWGDRQLGMDEDEFTRALAQGIPFSNSPGTAFEYSNFGFAILGRIIARVSGMSYKEYLTKNVLQPLGMSATVLDEREVLPERLARGHSFTDGKFVVEKNLPHGAFGSMGGLYSSVRDMARYAAFHLAAWPARDDPETGPLRRSSTREMQQAARFVRLHVTQGVNRLPKGGNADSYGYGLGAIESCLFDRIVQHGGGLPGYGSHLYLLPGHGVGIVVLANVTYAPARVLTNGIARILSSTGALQERVVMPAPALTRAQEATNRLLAQWDDAEADRIFADSYFLDVPRAKVKADLQALHADHGACHADGPIRAENWLRGTWNLSCEKGSITFGLTLAPSMPPKVQYFSMTRLLPPSPLLQQKASLLAGLIGHWEDGQAQSLLNTAKLDLAQTKTLFAETLAARGACSVDKPLEGDGKTRLRIALACERYPIVLDFKLDEKTEKIETLRFDAVDVTTGKCLQ